MQTRRCQKEQSEELAPHTTEESKAPESRVNLFTFACAFPGNDQSWAVIAPPIPANEEQRISALKRMNILDTLPEERLDRFVRLACKLFDVPIALVTLVDTNRQWFKARCGFDTRETPRENSFCAYAILNNDVMVVPDARADERFVGNPLVDDDPNIRFYAGAPLRTEDGYNIGTLCLIDQKAREFSEADRLALADLAGLLQSELNLSLAATTDTLTQLTNRRGFELIGAHALSICKRTGTPAALLFIDLDGFKSINDTYGHAAGDTALRRFSAILSDTFRQSDIVARMGGDEFCVLMTGPVDETIPLSRLKSKVETSNQVAPEPWRIEFSSGVVPLTGEIIKMEDWLTHADRLMYSQKSEKKSQSR